MHVVLGAISLLQYNDQRWSGKWCFLSARLWCDMIFICHKHIESGGSSVMCTYGEGKINESCETALVTGFCLRLSPSGSMGLIGLRRGGWATEGRMTLLSVFFIPLNTVGGSSWSVAFSAVAEHESFSLCLYQSSVLLLHCAQGGLGISFAAKVGTSEV